MSFSMPPLPEHFFQQVFLPLLEQTNLSDEQRALFYSKALKHHNAGSCHDQIIRDLEVAIGESELSWPEGEQQLLTEDIEPDTSELLDLLVDYTLFSTHKLFRQEQIKDLLSSVPYYKIQVWVNAYDGGDVAPCGRCDGDILENTEENLKSMPPCADLRCACSWNGIDPDD